MRFHFKMILEDKIGYSEGMGTFILKSFNKRIIVQPLKKNFSTLLYSLLVMLRQTHSRYNSRHALFFTGQSLLFPAFRYNKPFGIKKVTNQRL